MTLVKGHHELRHVAMVFGLPLDCCATPSVSTWQKPGLQLAPSQGQHVTDPHPRASDSGGITVTITIHFWIWRPSGTASRPRLRPRIKDETRKKWVSDPQRNLIVNLWASSTSFPTCCNQCLKNAHAGLIRWCRGPYWFSWCWMEWFWNLKLWENLQHPTTHFRLLRLRKQPRHSSHQKHAAVTEDMDDLQNTGFTDVDATLYSIMQGPLSKHGNYSGRYKAKTNLCLRKSPRINLKQLHKNTCMHAACTYAYMYHRPYNQHARIHIYSQPHFIHVQCTMYKRWKEFYAVKSSHFVG